MAGSGVWLHTGVMGVTFHDRQDTFAHVRAWSGTNLKYTDRCGTPCWFPWGDHLYSGAVSAHGYDSFQILASHGMNWNWELVGRSAVPAHELVDTSSSCMTQPAPLTSGCVPRPLRAGWRATLTCQCDSTAELLNCALTPMMDA